MSQPDPVAYRVPWPIYSACILLVAIIVLSILVDPVALVCIGPVCIGLVCSAPNFNLADGCLVWITILVGLVLLAWWPSVGMIVAIPAASGWIIGGAEKAMRLAPVSREEMEELCEESKSSTEGF